MASRLRSVTNGAMSILTMAVGGLLVLFGGGCVVVAVWETIVEGLRNGLGRIYLADFLVPALGLLFTALGIAAIRDGIVRWKARALPPK